MPYDTFSAVRINVDAWICAFAASFPVQVGRARSLEAILGFALFDADPAERYGWVNRALPADELDGLVGELAWPIADLAAGAIAAAKN